MPNPEKTAKVEQLTDLLSSNPAVFIADYEGLSVSEMNELRRRFRAEGVKFTISKNTLFMLAAKNAGFGAITTHLVRMRAAAFADEPAAPARVMHTFAKEHSGRPSVVGVFLDGEELDADKVEMLAVLPPRDVLLSKLAGAWKGSITNLASAWSGLLRKFVATLDAVREKRDSQSN
jgi:large subunit ribosomal protein L10